jgi:hypothetical protein
MSLDDCCQLHQEHCYALFTVARRVQKCKAVEFLVQPIVWVEAVHCLAVTTDIKFTGGEEGSSKTGSVSPPP